LWPGCAQLVTGAFEAVVGVASWRRSAVKNDRHRQIAAFCFVAISASAASTRASQSEALAQPLSMIRASGPFAAQRPVARD
jgi:hypothetical protein